MGGESIRVCVRYRPMNKVESQEDGNHICIKIAGCRRAMKITHPERPDRPLTFFFDQIYPPGVTQEDCYNFTGLPLVEISKEGFNATIFAYGQTGSGKTFSMMGVLGSEVLEGLIPRIIKDSFKWIEDDPTDAIFSVKLIMCEIYMERVKDLFNVANSNCNVKEDRDGNIYIESVTEIYCSTIDEVLTNMDNGFMNRSTSATRMNAESSRSHCVIILVVQKEITGGGKSRCAIKLVDLAGSEKTKKTQATGQRLEEAKAINQSLTALGQVMVALGTPGGFIPYRNSKLTRLLQDALGGNSKTSLLIAASPCSYNCEETISALRFGERAKKVKNKPKMNEELTVDEYKKKCAKMEQKIKILEKQNKLMKLQLEACMEWINGNGGNFDGLVEDIKIEEEGDDDEKPPDVDFDSAQEISSQAFVIDKKSGKVVGGKAFSTSIGGTPADAAKNAARGAQAAEDAKLEGLIRAQNDPNYGRSGTGGGGGGGPALSPEQMASMQEECGGLKAEARSYEIETSGLQDMLQETEKKLKMSEEKTKDLQAQATQFAIFKQKAMFLERNGELKIQRMKEELEGLLEMAGDEEEEEDPEIAALVADGGNDAVKEKVRSLAMQVQRLEAKNAKLLKEKHNLQAKGGIDSGIMQGLSMGDDKQKKKALMKLMKTHKELKGTLVTKVNELTETKKTVTLLKKREDYSKQLTKNWAGQLEQMERALVVCSQMHSKDRETFGREKREKDEKVKKLEAYIKRMTQARASKGKTAFGVSGKMRRVVGGGAPKKAAAGGGGASKRKKRRPSKNLSAGNVAQLST